MFSSPLCQLTTASLYSLTNVYHIPYTWGTLALYPEYIDIIVNHRDATGRDRDNATVILSGDCDRDKYLRCVVAARFESDLTFSFTGLQRRTRYVPGRLV